MADRIGFYGGTFNPIHMGHVGVCQAAVRRLKLDRLHLLPAFVPPHKEAPDLVSGDHRLEMCRLATREIPEVLVDDYELRRGGVSYTVLTLRHYREEFPDGVFYLLMGTDNLLAFDRWRNWEEIGALATLGVASREADDRKALYRKAGELAPSGVRIVFLENEIRTLSSTEIRGALRDGERPKGLHPDVCRYIRTHRLYGRRPDDTDSDD